MGLGGWENRCAIDSLQRGQNRGEQTDNRCGVYRRLNTVLSTGWAKGCSLSTVPHTQVGFILFSSNGNTGCFENTSTSNSHRCCNIGRWKHFKESIPFIAFQTLIIWNIKVFHRTKMTPWKNNSAKSKTFWTKSL